MLDGIVRTGGGRGSSRVREKYADVRYVGVEDMVMCSECAWHKTREMGDGRTESFCFKRPPVVVYDVVNGKPCSARPRVYSTDPACGDFEDEGEAWGDADGE